MDLANFRVIQPHHRALAVKIVELFGIDAGEFFAH
jgi:hypothetical protein